MGTLPRIMIVDDRPDDLGLIETILRDDGYDTFGYGDANTAIQAVLTVRPKLVLLSMGLPGMESLTLCRRFREHELLNEIPILVIVEEGDEEILVRYGIADGRDFVRRPLSATELRVRVATHITQLNRREMLNLLMREATHELYSPLGVIETSVSMMELSGGASPYLEKISAAVKMLGSTYKDIRYTINRNTHVRTSIPIDLAGFIAGMLPAYEQLGALKEVGIMLETTETPAVIRISEDALDRLVSNTLVNAVKYSPGKSRVAVSVTSQSDAVVLAVTNIGQMAADSDKIFTRLTSCGGDERSGLGFGLDVVRMICRDFDIGFEAEGGDGTTTLRYVFSHREQGHSRENDVFRARERIKV